MQYAIANMSCLKGAAPKRDLFADKADAGVVTIIAGSTDYHGAAALAGNAVANTLASLRIGAGYAYLVVPKAIEMPVRALSPNVIVRTFGSKTVGDGRLHEIADLLSRTGVLALGMGMGTSRKAVSKAGQIMAEARRRRIKQVLDGTAIYAAKEVKDLGENAILTPHDREFQRLTGSMPDRHDLEERVAAAKRLALLKGCSVLLKGHRTVVTDGKRAMVVASRTAALATMGTGDVLAGIIAGFAATGSEIFEAGVAGAYLHSRIGDALARRMGNHVIATDVVDAIPSALKRFD